MCVYVCVCVCVCLWGSPYDIKASYSFYLCRGCPPGLSAPCFVVMTIGSLPLCAHTQSFPGLFLHSSATVTFKYGRVQVTYPGNMLHSSVFLRWGSPWLAACNTPELPTKGKYGWRETSRDTIKMQNHRCAAPHSLTLLTEAAILWWNEHVFDGVWMCVRVCVRVCTCEAGVINQT